MSTTKDESLLNFTHLKCPDDVKNSFSLMDSQDGLKEIIEFIFQNQNAFIETKNYWADKFDR